jgi:hypothetical protein
VAERLLSALPTAPASRAFWDLQRRLLLSAALNPEGPAGETKLVVLRAEKLTAMGDLAGTRRLLDAVPQRDLDERLERLKVDAAWLAGDLAAACSQARQNLIKNRAEVWQRAQAFCLALDGDKEKADLAVRLLPEQGFADDPTFNTLMDAVMGNAQAKLASLAQPRPLDLAMLAAAHRAIPADAAGSRDLRVLTAIAGGSNVDPQLRLAAGERLEAVGAWRSEDLQKLYAAIELPADAIANAPAVAAGEKGSRGHALLWQAARKQATPESRLPIIERALQQAATPAAFAQTARVYGADIAQLEPKADLLGDAAAFTRGLLAAGRAEPARRWVQWLESQAAQSPDARRILDGLYVIVTLADADTAWSPERFQSWRRTLKGSDGEQEQQTGLALLLIDGAGHAVPPDYWREQVTGPARRPTALPPAAVLPALAAAAEAKRVGETVCLAEIALGETALGDQPATISGLLASRLRAVELADEARAFALEAAIAAGL